MRKYFLLVIILLFYQAPIAYSGIFSHSFNTLSSSGDLAECYSKLDAVAERFTSQTQLAVVEILCQSDELFPGRIDGVMRYDGVDRLSFTRFADSSRTIEDFDFFSSEENCLADLDKQKQLFEKNSKLSTLLSYCYRKSSSIENRWILQIEAVGNALANHNITGTALYGEPFSGYQVFLSELASSIESKGYPVTKLMIKPSFMQARLTVGFYSVEERNLFHNGEVRLASSDACILAKTEADLAFSETQNILTTFCDRSSSSLWGTRLNIYSLEPEFGESQEYTHRVHPINYHSYNECQQDRTNQLEAVGQRGTQVILGLCGISPRNTVNLHIFSRNRSL